MNITKRLKTFCCFVFILSVLIFHIQCQFDQEWDSEIRKRNPFEKYGNANYECGIKPNYNDLKKSTASSARIINGNSTTSKSYPWTAQIFKLMPSVGEGKIIPSSGTIISNMAIITCRHCICRSLSDAILSYATEYDDDGKQYYEHLPKSYADFIDGKHTTCLISDEGAEYPTNQNRPKNIVNYYIASAPFPGDPNYIDTDLYIDRYRQNIKVYIYEYDPEWILARARERMDKHEPVGTEAYYDKIADISIIIDDNRLNLKPKISSPACLPAPVRFHAKTKSGDEEVDVVIAGRGVGYEQRTDLKELTAHGKAKSETYTTCYTNQGMVRKEKPELSSEPHIFIRCKDYERDMNDDATENKNHCIQFEKARVNGNELDETTFKWMSTDADLRVTPDGDRYDIDTDDNCNQLWESAEEYIAQTIKADPNNVLPYALNRGGINYEPDILIVVEEDEPVKEWTQIFKQWTYEGTGPGFRCFNFRGLAANGICQTDSTLYPWGFCSRSCIFEHYKIEDGIRPDEVELDMAEFKYYSDPDSSTLDSLRLMGDREDNSTTILFRIGFSYLE